ATAIFFTCEVPFRGNDPNLRQVRLFLTGQALSLIYTPSRATFHEKSGLVSAYDRRRSAESRLRHRPGGHQTGAGPDVRGPVSGRVCSRRPAAGYDAEPCPGEPTDLVRRSAQHRHHHLDPAGAVGMVADDLAGTAGPDTGP